MKRKLLSRELAISCRLVAKVAYRTIVAFVVLFIGRVLYVGFAYESTLDAAAKQCFRDLALRAVAVGVELYDPSVVCPVSVGPGVKTEGLQRVDAVLHKGLKLDSAFRISSVTSENAKIAYSLHHFGYQPFDEPRLHELRKRFRLDEVVAGACSDFDQMVKLRTWCRRQFKRSDYQRFTANFDALEVLDRGYRDHGEKYDLSQHYDPCHFFPLLFSQVAISMGHTTRLTSIEHGMVEVWSNHYRKWAVMDAELDHHFVECGVPLNMVELMEASQEDRDVEIVRGSREPTDEVTTLVHLGVLELDAKTVLKWFDRPVEIADLRNDWMTNHYFRGHPSRSDINSLTFVHSEFGHKPPLNSLSRHVTSEVNEFYWTLNQAEIYCERIAARRLQLRFATFTPNFSHFEVACDGKVPSRNLDGDFQWLLHHGSNSLAVCPVNKFGVKGVCSRLQVTLEFCSSVSN